MKGKVWLSDSSKQHLNTPHKPEQHCRVHFTYEQICCAHPLRKLAVERAHPLQILYVNPWENLLWTTSTKVAGSLRKCTVYTPAKVAEYMYTLRKFTVHTPAKVAEYTPLRKCAPVFFRVFLIWRTLHARECALLNYCFNKICIIHYCK